MLDHLGIQVRDLGVSRAFYEQLLGPLGITVMMDFGPVLGFGTPDHPFFWIGAPDGPETREIHVAFTAPDRAAVRAVHDAAVAGGFEILHAPREFPEYHPGYYGVFVRDPDGHNVEAVCHQPE